MPPKLGLNHESAINTTNLRYIGLKLNFLDTIDLRSTLLETHIVVSALLEPHHIPRSLNLNFLSMHGEGGKWAGES